MEKSKEVIIEEPESDVLVAAEAGAEISELIKNRSLNFYYDDKNCPLNYVIWQKQVHQRILSFLNPF